MSTAITAVHLKRRPGAAHGEPEPMTLGIPWPRGRLADPRHVRLVTDAGQALPVQCRPLDRWPDGSVRWLLCDWVAPADAERLRVELDAGAAGDPQPRHDSTHLDALLARLSLELDGHACPLLGGSPRTLDAGPVRFCETRQTQLGGLHLRLEWHRIPALGVVRLRVTLRNPRAAEHPGGCWDLGAATSALIRRFAVRTDLGGTPLATLSAEPGGAAQPLEVGCVLLQESSGGERWDSHNHLNASRQVDPRFRGYRLTDAQGRTLHEGLRATPVVAARGAKLACAVGDAAFWQEFPRAVRVTPAGVDWELFPDRGEGRPTELQGGEQKTFTLTFAVADASTDANPLPWLRGPRVPTLEPGWVEQAGVIPYLTPRDAGAYRDYEALVDAAIEGEDTFERKREVIDQYGWRHFGEIYGDHEAVLHPDFPPLPRVSHYNNQYDAVNGLGVQWLRSGDPRWRDAMRELARHVIDIDQYHTTRDKAAYNGGLFWHTYHYVDADTGTHRSYPRRGRVPPKGTPVPGGGPSNEHNYAAGLALHYFLTGEEDAREAALELAQWVVDMDDGGKTVFRWLAPGRPTGLASQSRTPDYHGPGRGAANSVLVLIEGHRLSGEAKYLAKCEELIRRVIHPADDVPARNLLDAENRWFYTMFLQALAKYLDYQTHRGEAGPAVAYARASLLHYARWMAEHEYPYLQRPERLEYPTETWAAQDLRKGEIFHHAAAHSTDPRERERFRASALFFFQVPIQQLSMQPTRSLCRPVVLLLSYGWTHLYFEKHPEQSRPVPAEQPFGRPIRFVPQKAIAVRRAKLIIAAGALLTLAAVAWGVWRLLG